MIILADNKTCTGCYSCMNACPKGAISMMEDREGFFQPVIDTQMCVECGLCQKSCPVLNPLYISNDGCKVYAFIDYTDRKKSSSGGAFSFFARRVLDEGGIVFGATINEHLQVYHIGIDSKDDLPKLRGSKYVQSKIGTTYREARQALQSGRKVLFTGTPCQIAGLYKFLGKKWEGQLVTLDLVCHGVPNQRVFDTYLKKLTKIKKFDPAYAGNIVGFRFRNLDSWDYRPAVQVDKSETWHILAQESNVYMKAFFEGLTYRESCFHCQYANTDRVGNFTIADFWGVGTMGKIFRPNVSAGVSLIIDNCGQMGNYISSEYPIYIEERTLDEAKLKNENLNHSIARKPKRDTAIIDLLSSEMSLRDYAKTYHMLDSLPKHIVKTVFKNLVYGLGLYNAYKTIIYKLGRTS